jgi:hypothetical protein
MFIKEKYYFNQLYIHQIKKQNQCEAKKPLSDFYCVHIVCNYKLIQKYIYSFCANRLLTSILFNFNDEPKHGIFLSNDSVTRDTYVVVSD